MFPVLQEQEDHCFRPGQLSFSLLTGSVIVAMTTMRFEEIEDVWIC